MHKKLNPTLASVAQSRRAEWRELQALNEELQEKRRRSQERIQKSRVKFYETQRRLWDKTG